VLVKRETQATQTGCGRFEVVFSKTAGSQGVSWVSHMPSIPHHLLRNSAKTAQVPGTLHRALPGQRGRSDFVPFHRDKIRPSPLSPMFGALLVAALGTSLVLAHRRREQQEEA